MYRTCEGVSLMHSLEGTEHKGGHCIDGVSQIHAMPRESTLSSEPWFTSLNCRQRMGSRWLRFTAGKSNTSD